MLAGGSAGEISSLGMVRDTSRLQICDSDNVGSVETSGYQPPFPLVVNGRRRTTDRAPTEQTSAYCGNYLLNTVRSMGEGF